LKIMGMTVVLLSAGVVFLIGFAVGTRFKEVNLRMREGQLAQGRRELRQTAQAIQTHRELDWAVLPASAVVRRALVPDGELLVVADTRIALEGERSGAAEGSAA
jgi:hypothetical protein